MQGDLSITKHPDWVLTCPSPAGGTLLKGFYNSGSGLADDTITETDEFSKMQVLVGAAEADYTAYVNLLKDAGYAQIMDNTIGVNQYAEFTKDGLVYHVAFMAGDGELRVSEDRAGVPLSEFAYDTKGDKQTVLYQYGLYYDPDNDVTDHSVNCGMMYIVRLSDNRLVLVDGGHLTQATNEFMEGLVNFLHEITDTKKGETINVAAWYMTHAHGDHVTVMAKLCNRYHNEVALERVMFNIPSYQVRSNGYDGNTTTVKAMIRKYYPDVKFLKFHSGQRFNLSDLGIEVLYTHEDAIGTAQFEAALASEKAVTFDIRDYNSSSSVIRFTIDGKTFILLGDISSGAEAVIAKNFSAEVLHSDALQAAHHCINYLRVLYPLISAPMVLMPNSCSACHRVENFPKLEIMLAFVENDQIYYESDGTVGFAVVDGQWKKIFEAPLIGGEYDFSGI